MKIIVIGASSSLGKVLLPVLREVGDVVTAGRKNCEIFIDLEDETQSIIFPENVDVVIHMAAHFGGKTPEDLIAAEKVNALGTLRLCQASVKANVKHFVFISSIYAQFKPGDHHYSIYSMSKRHAEELAFHFCEQFNLLLTILRPVQLYGNTYDFAKHQPFFYAVTEKASQGERIELNGQHDALRNFLHVSDLAEIILKVIQKRVTGTYLCQFPVNTSISAIAQAALAAFNQKSEVVFVKDRTDIQDNVISIDTSLYEKIDFYPQVNVVKGMEMIANRNKG